MTIKPFFHKSHDIQPGQIIETYTHSTGLPYVFGAVTEVEFVEPEAPLFVGGYYLVKVAQLQLHGNPVTTCIIPDYNVVMYHGELTPHGLTLVQSENKPLTDEERYQIP